LRADVLGPQFVAPAYSARAFSAIRIGSNVAADSGLAGSEAGGN
jgi:hypothetical protein